ncbi:MAG: hypothetical protein EPN57_20375 [Paraburkholderia sp.]|nr:MAG: hypothetical protein EPN57_20375 [Paraburkholderia sp.]
MLTKEERAEAEEMGRQLAESDAAIIRKLLAASAAPAEGGMPDDATLRGLVLQIAGIQTKHEENIHGAVNVLRNAFRAALSGPADRREVVDEQADWQTGEPPVKRGDSKEFNVACRRAHDPSKIFVFAAYYANAYIDDNEDEEAKGRTGWFVQGIDMSGEYSYVYEKVCNDGDEIIGWQPLPKWSDEAPARAALATAPTMSEAVRDVLAERRRQVELEGFAPTRDDGYIDGQLAQAGAAYALAVADYTSRTINSGAAFYARSPDIWPWSEKWWKPTSPRRALIKAGALILAEIERIDRAAAGGKRA